MFKTKWLDASTCRKTVIKRDYGRLLINVFFAGLADVLFNNEDEIFVDRK